MTAEQLRLAAIELFGEVRGWKTRLAEALKSDPGSVTRWLSGTIDVPGPVEVAINCLLAAARKPGKKRP